MVHLAIKHGAIRLKMKIAGIIMDAELQNKHTEKAKIKKENFESNRQVEKKGDSYYLQHNAASNK